MQVKPLSPYTVELKFPEAGGRLVFELHVCGNFVVREYVGGKLEAEYHLPTTYRFDIQAGKTVAKFAWRLGLDPKAALMELREKAGELPAILLDRPLLQILKMFSRVVAQVPEAAPEDPLQLLRNATAGGLRIETLRESVVFRYNLEEGRWEPTEVECKGRRFALEEFRKLTGEALAGLSNLPDSEIVEAKCPVCGKRGRVAAGRLRRHLEGHLSRVEESVEELLSDRGFLDKRRDVEIALKVAELEETYGLSIEVDEANELAPGYYAFKILVEGSGGWSFLEGSLEECLSNLERILEKVAGDRVTCPFCGRSYLRVDAAERGECECGAAIVVGRSARSTDTYLSDALDLLIEMAAEDTPLLEAEEDALAILAEHFHIHKLLENVKYTGKGAMGWPTYFAKRPVRLTPAGQLLVNHALWAATLNVEEAEEELAARAGKCRERLWGLKRRGPCIGALCPLFAHCLRKLARETSSLELPAKTKRKLEKTASKIENHYEKLLKELEETLQKAQ